MDAAGIVLAGGRSSRMGTPKAGLEWHRSTLVYRVCGLVARAVSGPVIVVSSPGQQLPDLPRGVKVVEDPQEGRGPLQGLAAGLSAAADHAEAAYVSATDAPMLHPAFVRRVVAEFGPDIDALVPNIRGVDQPLAAAYATRVGPIAQELVGQDRLRFRFLFARCAVRRLDERGLLADDALAAADPELESVVSVDDVDAYQRQRSRPAPQVTIERVGALVRDVDQGRRPGRAATLAMAADSAGIVLGPAITITIDGAVAPPDPELPLAEGDHVTFALIAAAEGV
jgi:molybdenum cofactor guanylyltransferase